jgi:hypothetical protein
MTGRVKRKPARRSGGIMQLYLFLLVAIVAAIYAFSFALWLQRSGNLVGAYGVLFIAIIGVVLPLLQVLHISLW